MTVLLYTTELADSRRPAPGGYPHGHGWWVNSRLGKIVSISEDDLGPNGDHDGWISIGDNAMQLGVSAEDAMAYQDATYGWKDKDLAKKYPKILDRDGYVPGYHAFITSQPRYTELYDRLFFKRHPKISPRDAQKLEFPHLVRIRRWSGRGARPALLTIMTRWNAGRAQQAETVRSALTLLMRKYPTVLNGVGRASLACGPSLRRAMSIDDLLSL